MKCCKNQYTMNFDICLETGSLWTERMVTNPF